MAIARKLISLPYSDRNLQNNREPQGARIKEWVKRVWESQGYKKKKTGEGLKEWPNHLVLLSNY